MKSAFRFIAVMLLVVIIGTAFIGCRRNDDDTNNDGMMSDVESVASGMMSDVESGIDGIVDPSSTSSANGNQTSSGILNGTTSVN